jgi:hypothetical protein
MVCNLSDEFGNDDSLVKFRVGVRAVLEKLSLRKLGAQATVLYQPAKDNRCTASSTGFAMNIHAVSLLDDPLHELNALNNVFQRRRLKVYGGQPKLLDLMFCVEFRKATKFLAHIDDAAYAKLSQLRNIAPKRPRTQVDLGFNWVPPVAPSQDSPQKNVPTKCRYKNKSSYKRWHPGSFSWLLFREFR